jgi:tetratricopeptide (TPR) repeat protein
MAGYKGKGVMLWVAALAAVVAFAGGCEQAELKANEEQVKAQQQQIEELQRQIAAIKAQQSYAPPPTARAYPAAAPGTPGSCDRDVMRLATRRGGEAFSSGNLTRALGYYRDALTACPGNARAALNVARTYEAIGNRDEAIKYYRQVASSGGNPGDLEAARVALSRLGASR